MPGGGLIQAGPGIVGVEGSAYLTGGKMKRECVVRHSAGQSIIETVVGIMFLVPIALFLLDIAVVVMAHTANDNLAKTVARAAASAKDQQYDEGTAAAGYAAAQQAAGTFAESAIIVKPSTGSFVTGYCWNGVGNPDSQGSTWPSGVAQPQMGNVGVMTTMTVKLPVPFPFLPSQLDFNAMAVEPVVSLVAGAGTGADDHIYKAPSNKGRHVSAGSTNSGFNGGAGPSSSASDDSGASSFGW